MVAWFDSVILNWFQSIQNEFLTVLFKAITFLGEGGLIWIALGLCLIAYKKTRWVGISVLLALLFSLLVGNVTLKPLVARPRPCWRNSLVNLLIQNPKDYSFPSGHALSSFAAAMAIFMNRRKMGVAALLFAFIMGCTRLYFYVHYPTDVLAGRNVPSTAFPFHKIVPASGFSAPTIIFKSVDFPAPLAPTKHTLSPSFTVIETSRKTSFFR